MTMPPIRAIGVGEGPTAFLIGGPYDGLLVAGANVRVTLVDDDSVAHIYKWDSVAKTWLYRSRRCPGVQCCS